jgi:hypothetical protein
VTCTQGALSIFRAFSSGSSTQHSSFLTKLQNKTKIET